MVKRKVDPVFLIACLGLIPVIMAAFRVPLYSDDLIDLQRVQALGPFGATLDLYLHWSGRYTGNLVTALMKYLPVGLPAVIVFVVWFLGLYRVTRLLHIRAAYAPVIMQATIAAAPAPVEAYYWQAGLGAYGLFNALFTVWLALVIHRLQGGRVSNWVIGIGSIILAGLSETGVFALLPVCVVICIVVWAIARNTPVFRGLFGGLYFSPKRKVGI